VLKRNHFMTLIDSVIYKREMIAVVTPE